jgi:hypothetical protein
MMLRKSCDGDDVVVFNDVIARPTTLSACRLYM